MLLPDWKSVCASYADRRHYRRTNTVMSAEDYKLHAKYSSQYDHGEASLTIFTVMCLLVIPANISYAC